MTRSFLSGLIAALLCAPMFSSGQSAATEPASTIQASANLVVVDVVVTDNRHNPVHSLTNADFTVLENGHAQTIKTFEEHNSWEAATPLPAGPKLPPGTFTNYTNAPVKGALNILLLDALNTPISAQADVRNQMLGYLKNSRPGTRIAIFGLTTRLIMLQGFTSDPELLSDVLNGKKGLPKGSVAMTDQVIGDNPGADDPIMDMAQDVAASTGNDPNAAQVVANLQQFEAQTQSFMLQMRARYTLDALNQLARYLTGMPGRKNLIWFSGSFPVNILPDGDLQNPFAVVASSEDEFRETTDLLSHGQVAVYPIDARGLMAPPMFNAANAGARSASALVNGLAKSSQQTSEEHGTMQAIAEATGGEAYVNTNGLKEAVEKAVELGSHYYTLTYSPNDQKWNGSYRKIRVEVARQGVTLAYRRGYFADDPKAASPHGKPSAAANGQAAPYSAMGTAMMRGGPDPTEIILAASVRPAIADPEPSAAPRNKILGNIKGPFRRYTVLFGVDTHDIDCAAASDNIHHCAMDAEIFVYDAGGTLFNAVAGTVNLNLSADDYAARLKSGIHFFQDISVPVNGEYFLRIGVQDESTNKVGAVEVPIASVSKLRPMAASGTSAAPQAPAAPN